MESNIKKLEDDVMVLLRWIANVFIIILIIIFLLNYLYDFDSNYIFVGSLTFIAILLMLPSAKGLSFLFPVAMIVVGITVLLFTGEPIEEWLPLFSNNMTLIILILFVPVLALPLGIGKYNIEIEKILIKLSSKPGFLYSGITTTLFILGSIINLGSLSVIHAVTDNNGFPKGFLGRAYTRGFTSAIICSPFFASVFLIINTLDIPVGKFIMYSFSLGVLQLLISNMWFNVKEKRNITFSVIETPVERVRRGKVIALLFILSILIIIILISERIIPGNMSIMITVIVCIYSLVWSLFIRKAGEFFRRLYSYLSYIVPGKVNEVLLFLTAGFFSGAMIKTDLGGGMQGIFMKISNVSVFLFIFTVIIVTSLLAFIGVHQIVTITFFLASINVVEIGISNLVFALTLTCSWSLSTLLSPITAVNLISSTLLHTKVTHLIKWNYQFAIILICTYSIVIYGFHLL